MKFLLFSMQFLPFSIGFLLFSIDFLSISIEFLAFSMKIQDLNWNYQIAFVHFKEVVDKSCGLPPLMF